MNINLNDFKKIYIESGDMDLIYTNFLHSLYKDGYVDVKEIDLPDGDYFSMGRVNRMFLYDLNGNDTNYIIINDFMSDNYDWIIQIKEKQPSKLDKIKYLKYLYLPK
jgi:hypothetical protein